MASIRDEQPLVPSLLDRLLDDEPGVNREALRSRFQVLREMKRAVQRDLEALLNTRRRCLPVPDGLTELDESLVDYGLPDFTGVSLASYESREQFRHGLETVLRDWEPRFKSVTVTLLDASEPLDRTLRFRIDALLHAQPAPEPVVFDSALEPGTGSFQVKGAEA
jgi:type VI secretion system protein ImpF